jgi:hypothetical protein
MRRSRRVALVLVAVDVVAGLALLGGLTTHAADVFRLAFPVTHQTPRMTAGELQRLLNRRAPASTQTQIDPAGIPYTCTRDRNGGWDFLCTGRNVEALIDVSGSQITASTVIQHR